MLPSFQQAPSITRVGDRLKKKGEILENLITNGAQPDQIKAAYKKYAKAAAAYLKELLDFIEYYEQQILLAKKSVYEALAEPVAAAGLPLVNEEALPFPGRGQQLRFLAALDTLVEQGRLKMPT